MIRVQTRRAEVVKRGQTLYEASIRSQVEPTHVGKFLVLDTQTGDYEIDSSMLAALDRLKLRRPAAETYTLRIGFATAITLGGSRIDAP
jgi:hypothetical protein